MSTLSPTGPVRTGVAAERTPQQMRRVYAILAIAFSALLFDGYDIVIFGTIVSGWLKNPGQIGEASVTATQLGDRRFLRPGRRHGRRPHRRRDR